MAPIAIPFGAWLVAPANNPIAIAWVPCVNLPAPVPIATVFIDWLVEPASFPIAIDSVPWLFWPALFPIAILLVFWFKLPASTPIAMAFCDWFVWLALLPNAKFPFPVICHSLVKLFQFNACAQILPCVIELGDCQFQLLPVDVNTWPEVPELFIES